MQKNYIKPSIKTLADTFYEGDLLQSTGVTGDNNSGYGGLDTEGSKDPAAKGVWGGDESTGGVWDE